MLFALLQPGTSLSPSEQALKAAVDAAVHSSDRIIGDGGVLGACLILSLLGNVALVWLLVRVQNQRVKDTFTVAKVAQDMVTTFATVNNALEDLNEASKTQNAAVHGVTATLNTLTMSMLARSSSGANGPAPTPSGRSTR